MEIGSSIRLISHHEVEAMLNVHTRCASYNESNNVKQKFKKDASLVLGCEVSTLNPD